MQLQRGGRKTKIKNFCRSTVEGIKLQGKIHFSIDSVKEIVDGNKIIAANSGFLQANTI